MSIYAKPFSKHAATLALSALLVACGGGGSDPVDESVDPGAGTGSGSGGSTEIETSLTGDSGTADNSCRVGRGEDADSSNAFWDDNCWIERDVDGATDTQINQDFAESNYSRAIQRIVWCEGFADIDSAIGDFEGSFDDGSFGPNSEMAVIDYQTAHELSADGVVGTATWEEMQYGSTTFVETRTNSVDLVDIDVYSITSTMSACDGLEAFYNTVDNGTPGGWSMTAGEIGLEAEDTFSNGF